MSHDFFFCLFCRYITMLSSHLNYYCDRTSAHFTADTSDLRIRTQSTKVFTAIIIFSYATTFARFTRAHQSPCGSENHFAIFIIAYTSISITLARRWGSERQWRCFASFQTFSLHFLHNFFYCLRSLRARPVCIVMIRFHCCNEMKMKMVKVSENKNIEHSNNNRRNVMSLAIEWQ